MFCNYPLLGEQGLRCAHKKTSLKCLMTITQQGHSENTTVNVADWFHVDMMLKEKEVMYV